VSNPKSIRLTTAHFSYTGPGRLSPLRKSAEHHIVEAFLQQFTLRRPSPELVAIVWERVDPHHKYLLPRSHTLALLYMLHVETYTDLTPVNQQRDRIMFTADRIHFIGCYGNWVNCSCGCGRQWTFAIGEHGIWRAGGKTGRAGRKGACKAGAKNESWPGKTWWPKDRTDCHEKNLHKWLGSPEDMRSVYRQELY
jgi:hypothetical protein